MNHTDYMDRRERTRAERRHNDWTKALRKRNICAEHWDYEQYDHLHAYSKNKIHCSCAMCREKTNNKGKTYGHAYYPLINWSAADKRRLVAMVDERLDYETDGDFVT